LTGSSTSRGSSVAGRVLLAIDNSLDYLNLALGLDGKLIEERHAKFQKPTSEILSVRCRQLITDHGYTLDDIGLIAVTLGPGSFTGIRVALSFCKGMASGLGLELAGVPTLDVLAYPFRYLEGGYVCPLIDAKKGEVFLALYRAVNGALERLTEYQSVHPNAVAHIVKTPCVCFGSGLRLCQEPLLRQEGITLIDDYFGRVQGEALLRLGFAVHTAGGHEDPVPIYGRKSEAEIKFNVTIS
jgi:tRNA threonylcarbamoyladenosine biosynthesis protein TsaB